MARILGAASWTRPAALHHLGVSTGTVSMDILVEIGNAIRRGEREKRQEQKRENISDKALVKPPQKQKSHVSI